MLGGVAMSAGGVAVSIERRREQAVLTRLAVAAPEVVPVDVLVVDVWGEDPPAAAVDALRVHVSSLRKAIRGLGVDARSVLQTVDRGYRLALSPSAIDVRKLELALAAEDVLALEPLVRPWPASDPGRLSDASAWFDQLARRLRDRLVAAAELVASVDVAKGTGRAAVELLRDALASDPYRERLWEGLVRALTASEDHVEALRAYQEARATLADIGVEPGPGLRSAEAASLRSAPPRSDRPPMPEYVDMGGSRVAYAVVGDGPTDLLFLHGGFVPLAVMWDEPRLGSFLDRLADRFRVVLLDRRGIGMSDAPLDGPVRLEHWVDDVRAVLDEVGSTATLVLAHEHGGPVALAVAATDVRVRGMVLHSTAARPMRSADHPYGATDETLERISNMIDRSSGSMDMLRSVAPSAGDDAALRGFLDRAGRLGAGPSMARELHRAFFESDVRALLPQVVCPVVVMHPARFVFGDPGQARYLAEHLPHARLELLDSGDFIFWVRDSRLVEAAIDEVAQRATDTAPGSTPRAVVVLRALVATVGDAARRVLHDHAESTLSVGDATVAVFGTRAAADAAVARLRAAEPDARVEVAVADTTATSDDPAVRALIERVTGPTPTSASPV